MWIIYEILIKIWEKLKKNKFSLKRFWILKTLVENMRLTSINAKIRNFKNEKILTFLIDLLIESGPDP